MWEPATAGNGGSASPGDNWMTPSVVSATGQEYTRDGGVKGRERLALPGQATQATGMWITPHGMGGMDHSGKPGAGGEFAKQASQWLTPNVPNGGRSVPIELVQSKGTTADGEKRTVGLESQTKHWSMPDLSYQDQLPGESSNAYWKRMEREEKARGITPEMLSGGNQWPTPRSTDGPKGGPNQAGSKGDLMLPSAAAQWPTPMAADQRGSAGVGKTELPNVSINWPTPAARDYRGGGASDYETGWQEPHGHAGLAGGSLFAPGPADPRWPGILTEWPHLAPATEPGVRLLVDGVALLVDESRNHQLRQIGNGVCPLQAAAAVATLLLRAGITR